MSRTIKLVFITTMTLALMFGFMHLFIKGSNYNFERLHIFLFNLCTGGSILIYFSENKESITITNSTFLILSITYALMAFFEYYIPAMIISLILAGIVETIRVRAFSFFPSGFFNSKEPVYKKFHQAALLCLSIGLILSCIVILNNKYLHIIELSKLKLDTFFLGFSFPVSLITMSVIFSMMKDNSEPVIKGLKEFGFWSINLGVIIFFLFIIFEKLVPQVFVTLILFCTVIIISGLYQRLGDSLQQKAFLISGLGFLLFTAVTGIIYILFEFLPGYTSENLKWFLRLHSFASLYGWNLCGLAVICRYNDFPIRLHSGKLIFFHWLVVLILAPLGNYFKIFAIPAVAGYAIILYFIFFSGNVNGKVKA